MQAAGQGDIVSQADLASLRSSEDILRRIKSKYDKTNNVDQKDAAELTSALRLLTGGSKK